MSTNNEESQWEEMAEIFYGGEEELRQVRISTLEQRIEAKKNRLAPLQKEIDRLEEDLEQMRAQR